MKMSNEKGFSLIELLVVVVIIGIVAALAVPAFQRAITAAENRSVQATMKTMSSGQAMFFSQNKRFADLAELNTIQVGLGTMIDADRMQRNKFIFEMEPLVPTDAQLRDGYTIAAYRDANGITYRFQLTNAGVVRTLPDAESDF